MKPKIFLFIISIFFTAHSFAQLNKTVTLQKKTVSPNLTNQNIKKMPQQQPAKAPPPAVPTDLQKAVVNIIVGDDGKDYDTYVTIKINDGNKRMAAYYGLNYHGQIIGQSQGEYLPGDNETLPATLEASVPTGEMKQVGAIPLPVTREANLSDFTNNNGGSINMVIKPNGHDTWKIKSFSVTLFFNNDTGTPHKITWTGFTVSQDSRGKDLEFDKNFNPIQ